MGQFARKLLARFPAVAAKKSWQIFTAIAAILGFLEIVNKSLQQQVLNTPNWSLFLLGCVFLVYTVFATAYEESKDKADADESTATRVATAYAETAKESAIAARSGQDTIEGLRADLKEANDKLTECMRENAALREEIAGLRSRNDG
jgi:hypothetical protein